MDDFAGVTIALFAILAMLVALVLRTTHYWAKYSGTRYARESLVTVAMKAGDIVLFVAHVHSLSTSVFACNFFSHCGIVVDMPDGELYLSETSPEAGGATLRPLRDQIQQFEGASFVMRLETPLTAGQRGALRTFAETPAKYPTLATALGAMVGLRSRRRHCMQHVALALDRIGLTDAAGHPIDDSFYGSANAISELRELRDNRYLEPVELH